MYSSKYTLRLDLPRAFDMAASEDLTPQQREQSAAFITAANRRKQRFCRGSGCFCSTDGLLQEGFERELTNL